MLLYRGTHTPTIYISKDTMYTTAHSDVSFQITVSIYGLAHSWECALLSIYGRGVKTHLS